jgi:RNA polymerase sigma-70 factor, ECF subfamily
VTPLPVGSELEREICRRYASRIRSYGICHLRDGTAAQDLEQHVLVAVLKAVREGKVEEGRLDAYVAGTCRNAVMAMVRADARQRRIASEATAVSPTGYEHSWAFVDLPRLEQCLQALEARERAVIVGTFIDERDAEELGRALGISPGNVRVIRHRALARLQSMMEGKGEA